MKKMFTKRIFMTLSLIFCCCLSFSTEVQAKYYWKEECKNNIHEITKDIDKEDAKAKVWYCLKNYGYSDAACAGILGNFYAESSFKWGQLELDSAYCGGLGKKGGYWAPTENFPTPASNNDSGCGIGLGQWSGGRRENFIKGLKEQELWDDFCEDPQTDLILQYTFSFIVSEIETNNLYKSLRLDTDFAKSTDADACGRKFENVYEVSANGYTSTRSDAVKAIYKEFKGKEGTKPDGTAISGNGSKVEYNMDKMTAKMIDLYEEHTLQHYAPDGSDLMDMSAEDRMQIDGLNSILQDDRNDNNVVYIVRVAFMLFGILVIVYSVIIYLAFWFDRTNDIFELSALKLVTFGKLQNVAEDEKAYTSNGVRYVDIANIHIICISGVLLGVLILTGKVFALIRAIINKLLGV